MRCRTGPRSCENRGRATDRAAPLPWRARARAREATGNRGQQAFGDETEGAGFGKAGARSAAELQCLLQQRHPIHCGAGLPQGPSLKYQRVVPLADNSVFLAQLKQLLCSGNHRRNIPAQHLSLTDLAKRLRQ
jgi:hypothetical protein